MSDTKNKTADPLLKDLQAIVKTQSTEIEGYKAQVETLEKIALDQSTEIEELKAKLEGQATEPVSSVTVNKAKPTKKLIPEKTFKVGGKSYRFLVAQFRKGGEVIKAVDALKDTDLLKEIVEDYAPLVEQVK
jgi:hypothetical protein